MDLYSCFPSAIQLGLIAAGIDVDDARPFSLTGGLAFAGGPGNAYVVHSLASAVHYLRREPETKVLVTGIGMANTKQAATVLSAGDRIPPGASGATTYREDTGETPIELREEATGRAKIETYTIEYDREGQPTNVIVVLELADGARTMANVENPVGCVPKLLAKQPIGRVGTVRFDAGSAINLFDLDGASD